jgi:hypothetical protein
MATTSGRPAETDYLATDREQVTGWAGWVAFGGVMLIMVGGWQMIMGFVALFQDDYYLVTSGGLLVDVDYTTWGWVHLLVGAVAVLAGGGLLAGNMVARIVGVAVAFLSVLVNLAFIEAYPIWSTIVIVLDLIVIYAIIVHGRELKSL